MYWSSSDRGSLSTGLPLDDAFLDLLPAAIYVCERSGVIRQYNRRAAELWGRTPNCGDTAERFCGAFRLYTPDGRPMPHAETPMAEALMTGRPQRNQEAIIERPDGSRVVALVNIDPLFGEDGSVVGAVNVFQDITEKKKAQEALRAADRRKDEFLATLAHELRNPLAPVLNALEFLRLRSHDPLLEKTRCMMARQLSQMVRLVDDLLDVSRISRGRIDLRKENVALSQIVSDAVETSRPLIEAGQHRLELSLPAEDAILWADPARLSQVLANLLNNAAKYTKPGGVIQVSAQIAEDQLVIRVSDNGIGLAPGTEHRVFEMFEQLDHDQAGGVGIGLTLAKNLVELHDGTIKAHSPGLGQGTEFVVSLPLPPEFLVGAPLSEESERVSVLPEPPSQPARRILVVDDNVDSADSLAMLLDVLGHDVCVAHDGKKAIELAGSFAPELVFLDLGMPEMDGFEVASRLSKQSSVRRPQLIAMTGWGQEEDRRRTREAGFDLHLVKPVGLDSLQPLLLVSDAQEGCSPP